MKEAPSPPAPFLGHAVQNFRKDTGRSLAFWAALALLNFAVQIVFRRCLAPGEFGMFNSLLALAGLFVVPVWAMRHSLDHFVPARGDPARWAVLQAARGPLIEIAAAVWIVPALLLALLFLEALGLPRGSLALCTLPTILFGLGALVAARLCEEQKRGRLWAGLLIGAAVVRLAAAAGLTTAQPWAEIALAAGWAGGFVLAGPVLRAKSFDFRWAPAQAAWRDREFVRHFLATLSVLLGTYLFINGDRVVAQAWFGRPQENNMGYVPWTLFDSYQTAGLLGRALAWGTQPMLLLLLVRRLGAERTTAPVRNLFWAYLGTIIVGALWLECFSHPLVRLFEGGRDPVTAEFLSGFVRVMIPIGFLQGCGVFALASRRHPECFTFGAASIGYVAFLYAVGRPQLMLTYAFGGAFVALMLVLMVGVIRWGRRQP